MKNKKQIEVITSVIGVDLQTHLTMTKEQLISKKKAQYLQADAVERGFMYGQEVTNNVNLERAVMALASDIADMAEYVITGEDIPMAFDNVVMKFFKEEFPDFTQGASSSLGKFYNKAIKYIKEYEQHILRYRTGYERVLSLILEYIETSNSLFLRGLLKNQSKYDVFSERLRSYCKVRWSVDMQQEGLFNSDITREIKRSKEATRGVVLKLNTPTLESNLVNAR